MTYASENVTYCLNDKCEKKCWRYAKKYRFAENGLYWYMDKCDRQDLQTIKALKIPKKSENKVISREFVENNYIERYKIKELIMAYHDILPINLIKELRKLIDKE